jgi:hypothetical protein
VLTPQFVAAIVVVPPVLSVVLVAFSGGLTEHARQVLKAAAVVQAVGLVIGVISLVGAVGSHQFGSWFIFEGAGLAIVAAALIFTTAVTRSQAVRSLAPRSDYLGDDDEDFEDDDDDGDHSSYRSPVVWYSRPLGPPGQVALIAKSCALIEGFEAKCVRHADAIPIPGH